MQGRNRDTDAENRRTDTGARAWGGTNWECRTDRYTLPCVKQIASGQRLQRAGSTAQCSLMNEMGGMGSGGREAPEAGHICRHIADACCRAAEANNIAQRVCSNKKIIKIITYKIVSEVLKVLLASTVSPHLL